MDTAYIIPGYGESYKRQPGYKKVAAFFKVKNIKVKHVNIGWGKSNPEKFSDYTQELLKQFKKSKGDKTYILGFSYGATIAFLTATKTKPDALILCSLSPYFTEDQGRIKPEWLKWWKKTFTKSDHSFDKTALKIKSRTYLVVEDSSEAVQYRARQAKKKIKNSKLFIAKGAKHDISQRRYLQVVEKVIKSL